MRRSPVYWLLARSRAFLWRDLLFETSYKLQSLFRLASIFFQILVFYYLAGMVGGESTREHLAPYGGDYFTFTLIGLSFSGLFNAGLVSFTTAIRQQMMVGVLEAMAVTPIRSVSLLFYSLLWPVGFELFKALVYVAAGALWLGARVELVRLPLFVLTLALSMVVFGALGIIAGSLIIYFKRGDPLAWFISSLTGLIGGVYFPISVLPGWLETVARLVPVTYALDALRASLIPGADASLVGNNLLALAIFAVILVPGACYAASTVVDKARRRGNLGIY